MPAFAGMTGSRSQCADFIGAGPSADGPAAKFKPRTPARGSRAAGCVSFCTWIDFRSSLCRIQQLVGGVEARSLPVGSSLRGSQLRNLQLSVDPPLALIIPARTVGPVKPADFAPKRDVVDLDRARVMGLGPRLASVSDVGGRILRRSRA